jgi:tetratricopeptide (TPR) repeat protein
MLQLKRPKTALEFVRSDLAQNRESAALRVVESRALLELGQIGEARAAAERALTLDPQSADAHYQRGVVAMTERQAEPAVDAFERAIALDPNHIAAKKALATVEYAIGHPERARQLLEEVLALVPGDEDAKEGLALLDRRRAQSR